MTPDHDTEDVVKKEILLTATSHIYNSAFHKNAVEDALTFRCYRSFSSSVKSFFTLHLIVVETIDYSKQAISFSLI